MRTIKILFVVLLLCGFTGISLLAEGEFVASIRIEGENFVYQGLQFPRLAVGDISMKVKEVKRLEFVDDPQVGKFLRVETPAFFCEVPLNKLYVIGNRDMKTLFVCIVE